MQINHDDQPEDIIYKINEELQTFGLTLEPDDQEHDGYMIYELVENDSRISGAS